MFVKLTKSGPRRYLQLVESYRDENGRTKQRTVASLGRFEKIDQHFESVVGGLERATGRTRPVRERAQPGTEPQISFEPALSLGDVWSLTSRP